jgi:Tfp pilus assembly protein PilF
MPITTAITRPAARRPHWPSNWLLAVILIPASLFAQDFSHPDTEPAPGAALIQKANDALASGDFQSALKILTRLNTQTPHNPQILYDLGMTLEGLDSDKPGAAPATPAPPAPVPPNAESCYRQAIEANAAYAPPHVALGLLLARTNRAAEGHAQLATAVGLPDIDPALKARAFRALAKLDQQATPPNLTAASNELLSALKLSPEQPDDILLSAQIAEGSADFPGAEKAYRRYLAIPQGTGDVQATAALAHVLLAQHRPADAESLLTPALAQHPDNPSFTAQLAQSYLQSGDPTKTMRAGPMLEKLHTAYPTDSNISRLLARVYLEANHAEQAETLYASLIAASGDHPDPTLLDARAEALIRLHRPAEAEKLLKQAVVNPAAFPTPADFADAALHLAFAAAEIDDPKTTLQALALRARVQQPSPPALFLEATANDDLHQSTKAVELYKRFLSAAGGKFPDQESQARQRLAELTHTK